MPLIVAGLCIGLLLLPLLGFGRDRQKAPLSPTWQKPSAVAGQNIGFGTTIMLPLSPWRKRVVAKPGRISTSVSSGPAAVTVWIYPGRRAPQNQAQRAKALKRLQVALRRKTAGDGAKFQFKLLRYRRLDAIKVVGTATVNGRRRTSRTIHFFVGGREIVFDAYAPAQQFDAVDAAVFRPMLRSISVSKEWRKVRREDGLPNA